MKDHSNMIRGFTIYSEAWYAQKLPDDFGMYDQIMVGMYGPDGDQGTTGEFAVRWTMVGRELTPRLEVFNDAWHALSLFQDMLAWMAAHDDDHVTPKEFAELLRTLGIKDLTQRKERSHTPGDEHGQ